jgi:predicted RNA-binding Zn ribbon-like protein
MTTDRNRNSSTSQMAFDGDKTLEVTPIKQHQFKLAGGHPALDFINTVQDWTVPEPHDYLSEFADAIRFGEAVGLLTRADALRLRRRKRHIELTRLRDLRALLKRIFQKRLSRQAPSSRDLRKFSADLAEAARAARLMAATKTYRSPQVPMRREITPEKAGDALLRLRIVETAVTLLVSDAMLRVKSCPACGWFFLDVSKNRSRRWCSMDSCGAVAKARRYYRRLKERADP